MEQLPAHQGKDNRPSPQTSAKRSKLDGVMTMVPSFSPDPRTVTSGPGQSKTSWRTLALCLGHDPDLWFPQESDGGANAIRICSACPVRLDCLEWAIEHNERNGIWGGLSARKRQRLLTEIRKDGSLSAANPLSSRRRSSAIYLNTRHQT